MFTKLKQDRKIKKYLKENMGYWKEMGLRDSDICEIEQTGLIMLNTKKLFKHPNREQIMMTVIDVAVQRLLCSKKALRSSIFTFLDNEAFLNHPKALDFIKHICWTGENYIFVAFINKKIREALSDEDFEELLHIIYRAKNPSGAYYIAADSAVSSRDNALDFVRLASETVDIDLELSKILLRNPFASRSENLFDIYEQLINQEDEYKQKMIYDVVTRNNMERVISIISDYKSISKLKSSNEIIFKNNDLEETKMKTFEHFKDY